MATARPGAISEEWGQGNTWRFRVQVSNPRTGALADLGIWEDFWCTFKVAHDDADADALFQLNFPADIAVVPGDSSVLEITVPGSATTGAAWVGKTTKGYMDVKGRDEAGDPWLLAAGRATVRGVVTRAA